MRFAGTQRAASSLNVAQGGPVVPAGVRPTRWACRRPPGPAAGTLSRPRAAADAAPRFAAATNMGERMPMLTSHALRRRQGRSTLFGRVHQKDGCSRALTTESTVDTRADLRSYCYNTSKHAYIGVRGTRTIRPPESLLIVEHAHNILISFPTLALLALSLSVVAFTGQKYELHVTRYRPEGGRLSCAC